MSKISNSKKYDKLTPIEHVLQRSDTYVGSIENITDDMWIFDDEINKIEKKNIKFTPGFLKIFDELIVNASDHSQNDKTCDTIKVEYNKEEGFISVWNNGQNGIPVEEHETHKTMIPSMIFGEMLTGSNFDDNEKRTTGGRNGLGSKLANIFSTKFIVEIVDSKKGKKFIQEWTNNMLIAGKASVTKSALKNSYIKVTFYPDFKRFGIDDLANDHYKLFYRRTIDIAAINNLKVYFNEKKIDSNNFKSYIDLYYQEDEVYFDNSNERWTVGVLYKQDAGNEVISFVNSINTYNGGTHANHVTDNIIKVLINDYIKKKDKELKISAQLLKENLIFFINSTIENPSFSSQTKDSCTTKVDKFGSKYVPQPAFLKKLAKCGIVEQVLELTKFKENSSLKKTDGKKQVKIRGIPKLDDANKAGSKDSNKCSLILTEGDSAKTFAVSGLSLIGRDYYGIFPLKGKLLNTREANVSQLMNNEEINNLKKIIGLKHGEDYSDDIKFSQLRYSRIIILTDSDVDGSHIKGLIMNFIHSIWPSLIKRDNFITSLATPIVKATKGKEIFSFYNLKEYGDWLEKSEQGKNYKIKYYKGLGTSTSAEAKEYFIDFEKKLISYQWEDKNNNLESEKNSTEIDVEELEENDESIDYEIVEENTNIETTLLPYNNESDHDAILLAFDKKRADHRKVWLMNYDKDDVLLYEERKVRFSKFIHSDLIHFSNDDLHRSIPSLVDGLKPSQRKIVFGSFLRGLDRVEVKVAQLAGNISDCVQYHHGEVSLMGAIIGMAQNYVGSNNINILRPNGQFGTRVMNGKDSASPRYIWTEFEEITSIIFNKADNNILNSQYEDNQLIEPEYYVPIIPMIIINGTTGIGTGFSTNVPSFNPSEVINNLRLKIKNKPMEMMHPWFYGFKGDVIKVDNHNYEFKGKWSIKDNKMTITELPIGESIQNYKEFLEKLLDPDAVPVKTTKAGKVKVTQVKSNPLLNYTNNSTDIDINFELEFEPSYLETASDLEKNYHLTKKYSINNMHLFNRYGTIKKYLSVLDIIDEYFDIRLEYYQKRKDYQLQILKDQLMMISFKVKFLMLVIDKKLKINNKMKNEIENELVTLLFPKLGKNESYDYLLGMPLYSLTKEKVDQLKQEETDKDAEYKGLDKLSPSDIWGCELNNLELIYNKWIDKKNEANVDGNSKPNKINKAKKTKK